MPIRVVFFDCDGTLTKVRSSWEYLHRRLNLWDDNADYYQVLFRQGKIDYKEFCRRDALLWKDLPVSTVNRMINEIPYHENVAPVIARLKSLGIFTVVVSSGISHLVNRVKVDLALDMAFSNDLLSEHGLLTGDIKINVQYDQKGPLVREILGSLGLRSDEASAVGDGDGDSGMFAEVGLPIHFAPDSSSAAFNGHGRSVRAFDDVIRLITECP